MGLGVILCACFLLTVAFAANPDPAGTASTATEIFEDYFLPGTEEHLYRVPKSLKIGAATAAYQVEGAWNEGGKGPSIQDVFFQSNKSLDNGNVAANSYHKYKEDVKLLAELKMDMYRFSISWPRVLPTGGADNVNKEGVQYYHNLLDELLSHNIEPVVTLYHWDMPAVFLKDNTWLNATIQDRFVEYADFAFKTFGGKVKRWLVFNEPHIHCWKGFEQGLQGPGLVSDGTFIYTCVHNIILSHAKAYRLYQAKYKSTQKGSLGLALDLQYYQPATNSKADHDASERTKVFDFAWIADALTHGDYPQLMKDIIENNSRKEGLSRSRLPTFTEEEKALIKGAWDFVGLNHYTTRLTAAADLTNFAGPFTSTMDKGTSTSFAPRWKRNDFGPVAPWGLRKVLNWIKNRYNNFPLLITENGYGGFKNDSVVDPERMGYHSGYMRALMRSINEDGCNVVGYTVWSLLDNLSWITGYSRKFGLVHVDMSKPDRPRTLKQSSSFFQEVQRTKYVPYHPVI